jgi:hypothetical protein
VAGDGGGSASEMEMASFELSYKTMQLPDGAFSPAQGRIGYFYRHAEAVA